MDKNAALNQFKIKNTLEFAKSEIKQLRRTNELQSARLSGFDDALLLLNARTGGACIGMSEDVLGHIDQSLRIVNGEVEPCTKAQGDGRVHRGSQEAGQSSAGSQAVSEAE